MIENYLLRCAKINSEIYKNKLSILNFGNASIIDTRRESIYIKASGIFTKQCKKKDVVKIKLKDPNNLPQKSLKLVNDQPILYHMLNRIIKSKSINSKKKNCSLHNSRKG